MTFRTDSISQDYFRNSAAAHEKLRAAGPVVEVRFPIIGKIWTATMRAFKDDGSDAGLRWWMPGVLRTTACC